ncbi:MAG: hypothetical protein JWP58_3488 [Hymenobacter sp.]|nr:hypothetical protein [Hymenobacter sp.]
MAKKKTTPPATEAAAVPAQPYYLQRAHIKDFRSIRDAKVEFKPGLNIIIGANGSGKTNFVRVVGSGIDMNKETNKILGAEAVFNLVGRKELEIRYHRQRGQILDGNKIRASDLVRQEVSIATIDGNNGQGGSLFEALSDNKNLRFAYTDFIGCETLLLNHGIPVHYPLVDIALEFKVSDFFQPTPMVENFTKAVMLTFAFAITTAQYRSQHGVLPTQRVATIWNNALETHLKELNNWLNRYTPIKEVRPAETNQFYENAARETVVKSLSLEFKIQHDWLPFSELSSGTQRLFYLLSEITVTDKYLDDELNGFVPVDAKFDKVILLEEPELGIHPDQLHKLLLFLREQSEKHQLIITTHSPQVLDMLNSDELDRITICELDEKKGTQFRKLTKKKIATARKFMKDVGYLSDFWLYSSLEEKSPYTS